MQQYDSYKDSGVKWLGEIPSHWELCRFKNLVSLVTTPSNDRNKIGLENIESGSGKFTQTDNEFEGNGVHFQVNDVVYGKLRPYLQKVWLATFSGNAVGDFFVFRVNNRVVEKYLQYLMLSRCFTDDVNASTYGAKMPRVSSEYILTMRCTVPSKDEQIKIVTYLDTATAKIDAAIAQQQKMIDLLNERKQIIINRTVTRGLNPNVKMKDSGVEWIGEVPEEWEVRRLKHLLKANLMYGANESAESEVESYPRYIRITDIDEDGKLRPDTFRSLPPAKAEPYLLKKGDLLFARSGATAGKTYLFNENIKACFAGYLIKASLKETLLPEYLNYYTKSGIYANWKKSIFIQATIPNIGAEKYANLQITLPSIKEQEDIVKHLDVETGKINQVVRNCEKQISLLQERKQIIINEVVTGKVKVV